MANPDRSVYDPQFDDDLMFDTLEEQEPARGRPLMILLGIVVMLAFAGVVWVAYQHGVEQASTGAPPVLVQDPGPARVAPPQTAQSAVPDNPIYNEIGPNGTQVAEAPGTLMPRAEEPQSLPPASQDLTTSAGPGASPTNDPMPVVQPPIAEPSAEPAPDMTIAAIPPAASPATAAKRPPPPPVNIPTEISGPPPVTSAPTVSAVDPLPAGPTVLTPTAPPTFTGAATDSAAKLEKDRLARETARKAEAAKLALAQKLAAAAKPASATQPPAAAALDEPYIPPSASAPLAPTAISPETSAARPDASTGPVLLTPQTLDLPEPGSKPAVQAPPPAESAAAEPPPAAAPAVTTPTPAPSATGSTYVVQIGAYLSAEDAAKSWKSIQSAHSVALGEAQPEIRQAVVGGTTRYRLRATGYSDRAAASSACSKLKSKGQACIVTQR